MSLVRTALVIVGCGLLAAVSAAASLGQINERYPYVPLVVLQKWNGFSKSRLAGAMLAIELAKKPGAPVKLSPASAQDVRALSLSGYEMEPLDGEALGNLALLAEGEGDVAKARALFRQARRLSRRDLRTNLWLTEDYGRLGDVTEMLRAMDQALRSDGATRSALLPLLTQSLANPAFVEPVIGLLRKNPSWETDFWAEAFKSPPALVNAAKVRIARAEDGYEGNDSFDRSLMKGLVDGRHFAEAERLSHALGARPPAGRERVINADFAEAAGLVPFDWELFFSGSRTAEILPERSELRVEIFGGGGGVVARQLVSLPDSSYVLRTEAAEWEAADRDVLYARIRCAEVDGGQPVRIDFYEARQSVPFRKPAPNCTYNWLEIIAADQAGQSASDVTLKSLSIIPTDNAAAGRER